MTHSLHASNSMNKSEWSYLGILSLIWGCSFFFGEIILTELRPFTLVLGRVAIAAIFLYAALLIKNYNIPCSLRLWINFFIMGLFNNLIPFCLIFWGQTMISSSLAAILNASTPIWSVILAHFLTCDERLTTNRLIGVFLGFIGVSIMIGIDSLKGIGDNILGQIAVLGAGISYSIGGIYSKKMKNTPSMIVATGQLSATTIMMIPLVLIFDKPWLISFPSLKVWSSLFALAFFGTALAYVIFFKLLSTAGATNSLLVTLLVPVVAIFLGTTFLDEHLSFVQIMGMLLIAIALLTIDGRIIKICRSLKTMLQTNNV